MKKSWLLILVLALSIGLATFTFAAGNPTTPNTVNKNRATDKKCPSLNISEEQKAQITALHKQMLELRKQIIQDNLAQGTLTQDQAKQMEERINAKLEAIKSGKFTPGMGKQDKIRNGMRNRKAYERGMHGNAINSKQCPLEQQAKTN